MAEYKMSLSSATWDFPLSVALILMPIAGERKTGESSGPTYAQEAAIAARNKAKAFLHANYTIVKDPTIPWRLG